MRPQMIPDTHLLKLLFLTRYILRSVYLSSMCLTANQRSPAESTYSIDIAIYIYTQKTSRKSKRAPIHISMNQGAFYILMDEVLTKSLF